MKKFVSVFLVLIMAMGIFCVGSSAETPVTNDFPYMLKSECGGNCDVTPTIIVHGLNQSQVVMVDEDGNYIIENGEYQEVDLITAEVGPLVKKLLWPLLKTLFLQKDYISEPLGEAAIDLFTYNICDDEGKEDEHISVLKYEKSIAECTEEEKRELYNTVPVDKVVTELGCPEDHLYYFMYNSFGNAMDICRDFHDFVEMVKTETGHDQVNIVPISLGGTVMNSYMEMYKDEIAGTIDKIIYIVPASDGSKLISDIFQYKFSTDDESLYLTMFPNLIEGWTGYFVNVAIRILKNEVIVSVIDNTIEALVEGFLAKCTNMWALSCYEDWDAIIDGLHFDFKNDYPVIYEEALWYHNAQGNRDANLKYLMDNGTRVYDIVDTDYPLYCIVPSWTEYNADGIIHIDSTSLGCVSCPVGDTLDADDYEGKTAVCTDPTHNHINPAKTVDASYGLCPETTWYLYGQDHEGTARDDIILNLACEIIMGNVENIYNEKYPQFMEGRESKSLRRSDLPTAQKLLASGTLSEDDTKRLSAAVEECNRILASATTTTEEFLKAEQELNDALVACGAYEPEDEESKLEIWACEFFKKQSDRRYEKYGNRGFCELLRK